MTDISKYKAFPEGYVIPFNTKVICLVDAHGLKGVEGVTIETNVFPFCNWENGQQKIGFKSHLLAPVNPQDHPDYKQEEPEWQPKTGEVVLAGIDKKKRIYAFSDEKGHWCVADGYEESFNSKSSAFFVHWETISKYEPEPTPLKLTRAEIAEKFGTDNFEIID
jgi:hypothetical protein